MQLFGVEPSYRPLTGVHILTLSGTIKLLACVRVRPLGLWRNPGMGYRSTNCKWLQLRNGVSSTHNVNILRQPFFLKLYNVVCWFTRHVLYNYSVF